MSMRYLECDCCGYYHRENYEGDCRNDNERMDRETLEDLSCTDDIEIVPLEPEWDISSA